MTDPYTQELENIILELLLPVYRVKHKVPLFLQELEKKRKTKKLAKLFQKRGVIG